MLLNPFSLSGGGGQPTECGKPFLTGMRKITLRFEAFCLGGECFKLRGVRQCMAMLTFQRVKREWIGAARASRIQL